MKLFECPKSHVLDCATNSNAFFQSVQWCDHPKAILVAEYWTCQVEILDLPSWVVCDTLTRCHMHSSVCACFSSFPSSLRKVLFYSSIFPVQGSNLLCHGKCLQFAYCRPILYWRRFVVSNSPYHLRRQREIKGCPSFDPPPKFRGWHHAYALCVLLACVLMSCVLMIISTLTLQERLRIAAMIACKSLIGNESRFC